MSETPTTSETERSAYVPKFKGHADREAFKSAMLDEWKLLDSFRELRPLKPAKDVTADA